MRSAQVGPVTTPITCVRYRFMADCTGDKDSGADAQPKKKSNAGSDVSGIPKAAFVVSVIFYIMPTFMVVACARMM